LLWKNIKSNRDCPLHGNNFKRSKYFKSIKRERRFLSALKDRVSAPSIG
jgi:hypothetical protein